MIANMSRVADIDEIIRLVQLPVRHTKVRPRTMKGVDLSPHRHSLAHLVDEVVEQYACARDDWNARNSLIPFDPVTGQGKPAKKLEKNDAYKLQQESGYDYGEHANNGFSETWEQHWQTFYGRKKGHPGLGFNLVPTRPLHVVFRILEPWWIEKTGKPWRPIYPPPAKENDVSKMSPAGRFFLKVAQSFCDPRYTAQNCASVYERLRKPPKSMARRAERQRARIKARRVNKLPS